MAEEPGQGVSSEMLCAGLWTDVWLLGSIPSALGFEIRGPRAWVGGHVSVQRQRCSTPVAGKWGRGGWGIPRFKNQSFPSRR